MTIALAYSVHALHGSPGERDAFLSDVRARGSLEGPDLSALLDAVEAALDLADQRETGLREELSDAASASMSPSELRAVSAKISDAFSRLGDRYPDLVDELYDAGVALIEEIQ